METYGFKQVAITLRTSVSASDNKWAAMLHDGHNYYMSRQYDIHIDEYILVSMDGVQGSFVGEVCNACEKVLTDVSKKCYDTETLKAKQTKRVLALIKSEYDIKPEFLWENYPDCAAFRRKDNEKWFALIMTVDKSKLGLSGQGITGIVHNVYTYPTYRKAGAATTLLQEMVKKARQLDINAIDLIATGDGRPLYEKTGFHTIKETYMRLSLINGKH